MIATMLILMMLSFQFQLQDTANRTMFVAQMLAHEQQACVDLNRIILLAGVGMSPDSTMVAADSTSLTFRTYWDFRNNVLTETPRSVSLSLLTETGVGKQLHIVQEGTPVFDMGYILWVDRMTFSFFNRDDALVALPLTTASLKTIRGVVVNMVFKRNPPKVKSTVLKTKVQLRIYYMNCYLRGA